MVKRTVKPAPRQTDFFSKSRRIQVLIVDDHELMREGLRMLISHEKNLEVCGEAGSELEAQKQFRRTEPDLVVVDLTLKDDSGLDLIKWIKQQQPATKIVVSTMHDERVYGERALRAAGLPAPFALPARDRQGLIALIDALDPLPDALFCVNDELALMAIQLLQARGLRVPEDISVVGIDDIQAAHLTSPRLSTYRISWVEMGKEAANLICGLAVLDSQPATTVNRRVHGCLQIRDSSRGET